MALTDDVHAAARTLALLTHMNQTETMQLLDMIVEMDRKALEAMPARTRAGASTFPFFRKLLCKHEFGRRSAVCAGNR